MTRNLARDLGVGVAAGTLSGVIANQIPQNQKASELSRKLRHKKKETVSKSPWAEVGRGAVVAAPKHHPAWLANAVLNNPTATATAAAAGTGAAAQLPKFDHKRSARKERAADVASGAALGAGAGLGVDRAVFYSAKRKYLKPEMREGQNGRSAKREIKELKAKAAELHPNSPRAQEHYKNANWPERFKDAKLRRFAAKRTGGKNAAILAAGGAALGAGAALAHTHHKEITKMDHVSAFGVDHGYEISKKKQDGPSVGRVVTGTVFPGWHGAIAGKKGKYRKLKAAGTELGVSTGASLAGMAAAGPVGGLVAGRAGAAAGTVVAHKKGWLKNEPKR